MAHLKMAMVVKLKASHLKERIANIEKLFYT